MTKFTILTSGNMMCDSLISTSRVERKEAVRTLDGETVLTLIEASDRFHVPVSWIRKQIGKPRLAGGKLVRGAKFPADKHYYVFLSEMEEIARPRIFSHEFIEESQRRYEENPDNQDTDSPDYVYDDEEPKE